MRARSRRQARVLLLLSFLLTFSLAALAQAEVTQKGTLRVAFSGSLAPKTLPRQGLAPISVSLGGRITTTDHSDPPQLRRIEIAINSNGRLDHQGLPICTMREIQPSTTQNALTACGDAKVGEGRFEADVKLPQESPFPSQGKLVAFNGVENGRPVILAHVYGTDPIPSSYTVPFVIGREKGTFGTTLIASLPKVTSNVASITGLSLNLKRSFRYQGEEHSYLSAGCPAPKGFPGSVFPLARTSFAFAAQTMTLTLTRSCRARG